MVYFLLMLLAAERDIAQQVPANEVFAFPVRYLGKRIRACGVQDKGFSEARFVYKLGRISGDRFGVDVSDQITAEPQSGGTTCFTGVLRRRDGKSVAELTNAEKHAVMADGPPVNFAYYLAPR